MDNKKCCFVFNGYCSVAACSEILLRHNINNRIIKLPVAVQNSCSFAVITDIKDEDISRSVLNKQGISIEKILYFN